MHQHVKVPERGQKITVNADFSLNVPDQPIVPFIEGDGTGLDITPVMIKVVDAAVAKACGGTKQICWLEIYAGEKATRVCGPDVWLPKETLAILPVAMARAIASKKVTCDVARLMEGATQVSCSGFGPVMFDQMRRG